MSDVIRVLYIDDNPMDRELVKTALAREDGQFVLVEVRTRHELEEALASEHFDIILSDLNIAGLSGLQVVELVKERHPDLPVVIVTGTGSEEAAVEAMKRGAADYVIKTWTHIRRLPYTLRAALQAQEAERARRQAIEALRASEERLRSIFNNVAIGLYRTTPDGRILMANPALVRMLGFDTFEELAQRNLAAEGFAAEYPREQFIEHIERDGEVIGLEGAWIRRDGSKLYVRESAKAVRDETGRTLYYEGTVEDITERKRTEEALRHSLDQMTLLSRTIALMGSAEDLTGALSKLCAELGRAYKVPRAAFALLNQEGDAATVVAEYRQPEAASSLGLVIPVQDNPSMAYILEHKKPLAVTDAQTDPRLGPAREIMRRQNVVSILIVPILVQDEVVGTLGLDRFERQAFSQAEIELARYVASQVGQTLERVQLLAETREHARRLSQLAAVSEALNRPADVPRVAAMIGEGALTLAEADAAAVYAPDSEGQVRCFWSTGLSSSYIEQALEMVRAMPGGRYLDHPGPPILVEDVTRLPASSPLPELAAAEGFRAVGLWPLNYEGRTIAAIGCYFAQPRTWSGAEQEVMQAFARQAAVALENARLIQTLQQTNQELRDALQAKEHMIQSVSHELRTPLTLIMGYTELLSSGLLGLLNGDQRQALQTIESQSEQLLVMVNRLLTLQTLDSSSLDKVALLPTGLLEQVVQKWRTKAAQTGHRLRLNVQQELPKVWADPYFLEQVLDNLLENAIKFSPDGGVVELSAWSEESELIVAVSDEGIGIDPEQVERLFERFYQAESGPTRRFGGMGIGLSLCKAIVEAHGGRIWGESKESQGSRFCFTLPRCAT